jgi:chromosome segregation ATPase
MAVRTGEPEPPERPAAQAAPDEAIAELEQAVAALERRLAEQDKTILELTAKNNDLEGDLAAARQINSEREKNINEYRQRLGQ